jgi:ribose transport system permease protein
MTTAPAPASESTAVATTAATSRSRFTVQRTELILAAISVLAFLGLAVTTGGNLVAGGTLRAVFQYLAVPIVIGLAQMVCLAVGQLNLSVGVCTGLCAMTSAALMTESQWPAGLALAVGVFVGAAIGLVNGLLVIATKINGFIVTLATMSIIAGVRYGINGTGTYQGYSESLVSFGRSSVIGVPTVFLVAVLTAGLVWLFFARTVAGRRMLASGGNPVAATLSGISNDRSIVIAHTLSGLLAGVASGIIVALSGSVNASIGDDLLLASFAAPIIGGVALTGGVVSVVGTCLAAFIVRLVDVAQAQFNINPRWVDLVVGAVVLGAVLVSQKRIKAGGSS